MKAKLMCLASVLALSASLGWAKQDVSPRGVPFSNDAQAVVDGKVERPEGVRQVEAEGVKQPDDVAAAASKERTRPSGEPAVMVQGDVSAAGDITAAAIWTAYNAVYPGPYLHSAYALAYSSSSSLTSYLDVIENFYSYSFTYWLESNWWYCYNCTFAGGRTYTWVASTTCWWDSVGDHHFRDYYGYTWNPSTWAYLYY